MYVIDTRNVACCEDVVTARITSRCARMISMGQAAGRDGDQPRVLVYVEKHARVIMQSYIPVYTNTREQTHKSLYRKQHRALRLENTTNQDLKTTDSKPENTLV